MEQPRIGLEPVRNHRPDIHRKVMDTLDDPAGGRQIILQLEQPDTHSPSVNAQFDEPSRSLWAQPIPPGGPVVPGFVDTTAT